MLIKALEREREQIFDNGMKKGIEDRNRQIAQAMVANGFTLPTIAHLLNLTPAEVEALLSPPKTDTAETTTQGEIA
jgi:hypothetical protein